VHALLAALALAAGPAPSATAAAAPVELAAGETPTTSPPPITGPSGEVVLPPQVPYQLRIAFLPLISYGSNVGLQLGGALVFYKAPKGGGPRRDWLALGGSYATHGPRSIEVKGEQFDIAKTPTRAFYQAKYAVDDSAPYWGEGARLAPGDKPGAGAPPDAYRYRGVGPWLSLVVREPLPGAPGAASPWSLFARVRFRRQEVLDPGAALASARPAGFEGGTLTMLHAGVLRDTRDEEISPARGAFLDASIFAAPPLLGTNTMAGGNVGYRVYHRLRPGVVLAARAMYELKLGDVPFYERTQIEGLNYGEGIGGPGTLRGVARARLAGEEKILANVELRATLVTFRPADRPLELGVSTGLDAGSVRQRGYSRLSALGGFGGLRAIWDRALVVRFEAGYANQGEVAWYLAFDESF
jgi:hypothetical protein